MPVALQLTIDYDPLFADVSGNGFAVALVALSTAIVCKLWHMLRVKCYNRPSYYQLGDKSACSRTIHFVKKPATIEILVSCNMSQSPYLVEEGKVIDGKAVAAQIREEVAATVRQLQEKHGKVCMLRAIRCCCCCWCVAAAGAHVLLLLKVMVIYIPNVAAEIVHCALCIPI